MLYHNLAERRWVEKGNKKWRSVQLVSYTDSTSEEEDLQVDVNFDEPIDLAINQHHGIPDNKGKFYAVPLKSLINEPCQRKNLYLKKYIIASYERKKIFMMNSSNELFDQILLWY